MSPPNTESTPEAALATSPEAPRSSIRANVESILEAAPDAMVIVGRDGRIALVNAQAEALFGYKRDELLGMPIEMLIPERFHPRHPAHREGYFNTPRTRPMGATGTPLAALRKDGTELSVEISLAPLVTDEGTFAITALRDVSDRIRAEDAQRRLAAIVESSDDAILSTTLDGTIMTWNPGAQRIYGYEPGEIIGKSLSMLTPPGKADNVGAILKQIQGGEHIEHYQTIRRRKDGREIHMSLTVSPIRDARGIVVGASSIGRDVTELKQAEEALQQAKAEADAANRELEAFSYSVAHDLRAPLRAITSFSEIVLEDHAAALTTQGQDYLRRVVAAAQRMGNLIEALLSLSRVSRTEIRREPIDVTRLAHAVVAQLSASQPEQGGVEVVIQEGITAFGDASLVRAALENLLGNAWKFTGKRPEPRIEVGSLEKDNEKVYFVKDNGAGFDMAYSGKLFTPFQRLHRGSAFPGTGIGLATVQRIVNRHGGRIWAESAVDQGATFYFTLQPSGARS